MIKLNALLCWMGLMLVNYSHSQQNYVFTSLSEALNVPADSVYRLDLSREGYTQVPAEIIQFTNLVELDLRKNKLTDLPANFIFPHLKTLHLGQNKFQVFPTVLCQNTSLTHLYMGKNAISEIPECIGNLVYLQKLDLWFNTVSTIPESMVQLRNLRSLDLRGMNYSEEFQEKWRKRMPWVTFEFDLGCDCGI